MQRMHVFRAHQPRDAMLIVGLSGIAQAQEDPMGAVDPLTLGVGRSKEAN